MIEDMYNAFLGFNLLGQLLILWLVYNSITFVIPDLRISRVMRTIIRTINNIVDSSYDNIQIKKAKEENKTFKTNTMQTFPLFKQKKATEIKKEESIINKNIVFNQRI